MTVDPQDSEKIKQVLAETTGIPASLQREDFSPSSRLADFQKRIAARPVEPAPELPQAKITTTFIPPSTTFFLEPGPPVAPTPPSNDPNAGSTIDDVIMDFNGTLYYTSLTGTITGPV